MTPNLKKYLLFFAILLVGAALDLWTKQIAADRLATTYPGGTNHAIVLEVPEEDAGTTVESFLSEELTLSEPEEIERIAQRYTFSAEGIQFGPSDRVSAGQRLEISNRKVVVIDGYWDFQYGENPGAAFSLLADLDDDLRVPFFVAVTAIALILLLVILRDVPWEQKLMIWGTSFVAAGAVGNLINRLELGYVIDFIVWKYTSEYRWPTFNLADVFICIGVALIMWQILRQSRHTNEPKNTTAEASS